MKNTINHLRNHLFAAIERIADPEEGTDMNQEIKKAETIATLAREIVSSAKVEVAYMKMTRVNRELELFAEEEGTRLLNS